MMAITMVILLTFWTDTRFYPTQRNFLPRPMRSIQMSMKNSKYFPRRLALNMSMIIWPWVINTNCWRNNTMFSYPILYPYIFSNTYRTRTFWKVKSKPQHRPTKSKERNSERYLQRLTISPECAIMRTMKLIISQKTKENEKSKMSNQQKKLKNLVQREKPQLKSKTTALGERKIKRKKKKQKRRRVRKERT